MKDLADTPGGVTCIPRNEEKYLSFTKRVLVSDDGEKRKFWNLKFSDSCNFMKESLEKLTNNLDRCQLKHMNKYFKGEKVELMCGKGVYPYEYMTDVSKFSEEKLPPIEAFAKRLNAGTTSVNVDIEPIQISDKEYQYAQNVFITFGCKNLSDFTEVYVKQDDLLLADVIENFTDVCLEKYELDPFHYISAPSLSYSAMLKMTGVELELLTDRDMYIFFEKGIRGGVSVITGRYGKANNPYISSKCLRGESLMGIAKHPWTVKRICKEFSEKTAEEITKYLKKRLGGHSNSPVDDLREKMKEGNILSIEEAVKIAIFIDKYSISKGMDAIRERVKNEQQWSVDNICAFASEFFLDFNAEEIKMLKKSKENGETFNPEQTTTYIMYLDANNLYGWAMSQPLPTKNFKWIEHEKILGYMEFPERIKSCTLEVDLEYPKKLHDAHNDYPLTPELVNVNGVKKLIPNLNDKKNYVIHHGALQQCLNLEQNSPESIEAFPTPKLNFLPNTLRVTRNPERQRRTISKRTFLN